DPLGDPRRELDVSVRRQLVERPADEGVARETRYLVALRRTDLDVVGQRYPLVHGRNLVLSVGTARADDQREVDLRRGGGASHGSAAASATKSGGASSSARVAGARPIVSRARTASSRAARPASSSEFASVLRRCANAA